MNQGNFKQKATKETKKEAASFSLRPSVQKTVTFDSGDGITRALNEVYAEESSVLDPVLVRMQASSLDNDEW